MDFVIGLPMTPTKKDAIWVTVDRLMKCAHFLDVRTNYSLQRLPAYFHNILLRSKIHIAILEKFPRSFGFEDSIHDTSVARLLQSCLLEFTTSWEQYLPLAEFTYNNKLAKKKIIGLKLNLETKDKVKIICKRLKATLNRKKTYADLKRQDIEYQIGEHVFLKVSLWKKVLRFGRKGKLSPRFIKPYQIVEGMVPVVYQFNLPPNLRRSMYHANPSHVVATYNIEVRPDLTYEEQHVKIVACEIPLVKVLWCNHKTNKTTWETEKAMNQ
ncbi:DNA/RNA polymerases superfamily protein [Gossypium australe]|uniref:DNA/RNA polymerases superfamily protein n=1 Tax=Gossypium australe TaxID=47621 RepID=A0A5B6X075_9ROSI|nr:DNA/RNA polymerases superfamily protein [Gossypium australe]